MVSAYRSADAPIRVLLKALYGLADENVRAPIAELRAASAITNRASHPCLASGILRSLGIGAAGQL